MTIFEDVGQIRDTPYDRAVKVTAIMPDGKNGLNLQEGVPHAAQKARLTQGEEL
jgi:hypothetical protein